MAVSTQRNGKSLSGSETKRESNGKQTRLRIRLKEKREEPGKAEMEMAEEPGKGEMEMAEETGKDRVEEMAEAKMDTGEGRETEVEKMEETGKATTTKKRRTARGS